MLCPFYHDGIVSFKEVIDTEKLEKLGDSPMDQFDAYNKKKLEEKMKDARSMSKT